MIRRIVGFTLGMAMVATACTSGPSSPSTVSSDDGPSIADIIALEGTEAQAPYLADGSVTAAEREAAFLAMASCTEAQGVRVTTYDLYPRGGEHVEVSSDLPEDEEDRIVRDCRQEYYLAVAAVYARQHGLTAEEEAAEAERIAECMREDGVDVPEGLSFLEMNDIDPTRAVFCYQAIHER
jgi:hypothetical protein